MHFPFHPGCLFICSAAWFFFGLISQSWIDSNNLPDCPIKCDRRGVDNHGKNCQIRCGGGLPLEYETRILSRESQKIKNSQVALLIGERIGSGWRAAVSTPRYCKIHLTKPNPVLMIISLIYSPKAQNRHRCLKTRLPCEFKQKLLLSTQNLVHLTRSDDQH